MSDGYEDLIPAKKPSAGGYDDLVPAEPKKKEPDLLDRAARVGRETLTGGIYGAFAPEMMEATGGAIRSVGQAMGPYGRIPSAVGGAIETGGRAMKVARPASFAAGTLGGAIGETSGQVAESQVGPGLTAETSRLLGATLGPAPFQFLGTTAGKTLGTLAGKLGVPGMSTAKTIGQLLQEANVRPASLTAEQRAFIEKKLSDIRGGQPSLEAQKEIMDMLKSGAQRIVQTGEQQALQLEQQAAQAIADARSAGGRLTAELQGRINNLQSQFESAAMSIRDSGQKQAQKIMSDGQNQANRIRENAAQQTPSVRQIAEAEAKAAIDQARSQADKIMSETTDRINRLQNTREKLKASIPPREAGARRELGAVGEAQTPTQTGTAIRDAVNPIFEGLKQTRSANAEKLKGEAFSEALEKERAGQNVSNTQAFKDAITAIKSALVNPETKLTNVSVDEVKSQLLKVKRALDPREVDPATGTVTGRPASFEALENLRRFLRDRAYGLPAEGFDAIGQQQAGRLADAVEAIQREFSPKISRFLEQYRKDSEPLRAFKTKLGQAVVGKEEFDMGRFATDPATLGSQFFKSETGVRDLMTLLGGDAAKAEGIARGFVADKLRDASAKDVQKFLSDSRDWIGQFPALRQQLTTAAQQMATSERVSGKRTKLADVLKTEIGTLPIKAQTGMTRLEEDAARAAAARVKAGEKEATGITTAAEKAAGKVETEAEAAARRATEEAERQIGASAKSVERQRGTLESDVQRLISEQEAAAKAKAGILTKEAGDVRGKAQELANLITSGDTTGPARIRDLILSKNERELSEASKIILSSPGGKEKFGEAVSQVIAEKASKNLKGAIDDWRYIGDNLVNSGLMTPRQVADIQSKLQEVFVAPVDMRQKITWAQRLVRNAMAGYVGPAVTRAIEPGEE